ncbi:MAG TPA: MarR family transcriptional regulator [Ilumatobacteraceae bacterium]|jgi:DNA-binding MarR family transcriptional regulator
MTVDEPTLTLARLSRLLENNGTTELSLPQYRLLGLLSSGEERASQLAARLAVAKPTLTSLVDNLVERGLVARDAMHGDRRAVRVSITAAGRLTLGRTAVQLRSVFDRVLERCDDSNAVLAALADLRSALDGLLAERPEESPAAVGATR